MSVPILTTKLYKPPPRFGLVARPRLIEQLNQSLQGKLTLVSAPAGFGKTTLVSDWLRYADRPAAWLSLDHEDNDPARFLAYFIAALREVNDSLGIKGLEMLQAPQPPAAETVLATLINEIAAAPNDFILVFDDYHVIESQVIDEALLFLIDHLPRQMHLIIVSRTDPSLPLPRLRASGQLTEIRADDLRFTHHEAAVFLNTVMGLRLSRENVAALETRTEGWIAGLQLAALSMQGLRQASDITAFIDGFTGSKRYIIDYLADEVLQQRPGGTRDFLLQTSILDRLSGPLCEAVTGLDNCQTILETLERANLFIVPLDDERCWYRYHHLFTDLLRNRLEALQPELVPGLHRRASAWYETEDSISEAITHSLAAKDWEKAAQLIDQTMNEMMGRGEFFTTMLNRLKSLPPEIIRARPHFGVSYAWLLSITLQLDAVEPRLQEVEEITGDQLSEDIRLQIAVVRTALARQRSDAGSALTYASRVLEALPADRAGDNPLQRETRIGIAFNLADTHLLLQGDVTRARQRYGEALVISQEANSLTLILAALSGIAQVQMVEGSLSRAEATYREGLRLATETSRQSGQVVPAAAYLDLGLGNLLREWNQPDEAAVHLARGIETCQQWQIGEALCDGYLFLARLHQSAGDFDDAMEALEQAEQLPQACQTVPRFGGSIEACRAQLMLTEAVSSGDTAYLLAVEQWLEGRGRQGPDSILSLDDEHKQLIWANYLIARNEPEQALQHLDRLQRAASEGGRTGSLIKIVTLRALAQQLLGDIDPALASIEPVLSLAETEGYVRLFIDQGRPMAGLLRLAAARGLALETTGKLLGFFEAGSSEAHRPAEAMSLVEPLSERELEVLRLIATGLTNQEIAGTLVVALGTVKAHTASIYSKLNVHNRTQAVARARELLIL